MVNPYVLGGYAGQAILALVCLAALVTGLRLLLRSRRRGPSLWLGLHLTLTTALIAFGVASEAVGLTEPMGGLGDRVHLGLVALGSGVFLLHVPLVWSYPRQRPAGNEGLVAVLPWIAPAFGALYVFLAWPGLEPSGLNRLQAGTAASMRQAWFNRYDVLEDGAFWLVVACLVVGVLVAIGTLSYRALRGTDPVARRARRMLAQALAPVGAWLAVSSVLVLLAIEAPSGPVGSAVTLGFEALWGGEVPFALVLMGPTLWGLDLLRARGSGGRALDVHPRARPQDG